MLDWRPELFEELTRLVPIDRWLLEATSRLAHSSVQHVALNCFTVSARGSAEV